MKQQVRKKAVGYTRVSTTEQAEEGHSLEAQKDIIIEYCLRNKYEYIDCYKDPGISGKDMNRPGLQKMLSEIESGMVIICVSLSRLSRSVKDIQYIIEIIKEKGASIVFLDLNIDTSTAVGDLMLTIMSGLSQFERKQTSERVSHTMNNMSREGKLITKPRYGYKIIKNGKNSQIVEDPDEQGVIDKIRKLIQDDPKITVSSIVKILTKDDIKIRKAKKIYPDTITKIIKAYDLRAVPSHSVPQ